MVEKRWVWANVMSANNGKSVSVLACFETFACAFLFLVLVIFFDFGIGLLMGSLLTPVFFLRSPSSLKETKGHFELIRSGLKFQMFGALCAAFLFTIEAPWWAWGFALPLGYCGGHLFDAWFVQFMNSISHSKEGIKHLSDNYFDTLFVKDITTRPEMFPGSEEISSLPQWSHSVFYFPPPRNPITFLFSVMMTLTLFGVVLLRFSAKASALVCLPLIYVSLPSGKIVDPQERLIWIKSQSAKSIETIRLFLAASVLLSVAWSTLDLLAFSQKIDLLSDENPFSIVAMFYFVTDLKSIQPWQAISAASAVITVFLYFVMDSWRNEAIAGRNEFPKYKMVVLGLRIRTLLTVAWFVVSLIFALKYYYFDCTFGSALTRSLFYVWGEAGCGV